MRRKIVVIDEAKCNGCGLCVPNCKEGALQIIHGKAKLVSEVYCDGLGACLGHCPQDAIQVEEREANAFDEAAVEKHLQKTSKKSEPETLPCGCPGTAMRTFTPKASACPSVQPKQFGSGCSGQDAPAKEAPSALSHWPVQLMLVPPHAAFLKNADLLICADCVAFALADLHSRYLKGRAVLVGCPKLDDLAYYQEKIRAILKEATPKSLTVLRMEVPCCGGIAAAAIEARNEVAPNLPLSVHTIGIEGEVQNCENVPVK